MNTHPTLLPETAVDEYLHQYFSAPATSIADEGFAAAVLANLPAKHPLSEPIKQAILILPALVFALLIQTQLPLLSLVTAGIEALTHELFKGGILLPGIISLAIAWVCAAVFFNFETLDEPAA